MLQHKPHSPVRFWAARGMSLRNVSYEAFVFSVFSRNRGKTKPLTWRSVSSLLPSQAAPNLTASRYNVVAIQISIKISFTWQFESLRLIFIHFRLAQVTRFRQMFEMSHAGLKQWRAQRVLCRRISYVQDSIWKASTLSIRLLKWTSPKFRRLDGEICVEEPGLAYCDVFQTQDVAGFKHRAPAHNAQDEKLDYTYLVWCPSSRSEKYFACSADSCTVFHYTNCIICISNFQMAQAAPPRVRPTTWCFALRLQMPDFSTAEEVRDAFCSIFNDTQQAIPGLEDFSFSYGVPEGGLHIFADICTPWARLRKHLHLGNWSLTPCNICADMV